MKNGKDVQSPASEMGADNAHGGESQRRKEKGFPRIQNWHCLQGRHGIWNFSGRSPGAVLLIQGSEGARVLARDKP